MLSIFEAYKIIKACSNNAEILWFEWMFDIGYLDQGIDSEYRMELLGRLIMEGCFGKDAEEYIMVCEL